MIFNGVVLLDELVVVLGVADEGVTDATFAESHLRVPSHSGVQHQVNVLFGSQLNRELVVERQVNYLPVVDSDRENRVLLILVSYLEDVGALPRQHREVGRVGSLLLEVCLLGGYHGSSLFVLQVIKGKILQFEFLKTFRVGGGGKEVDGGAARVPIDKFGLLLGNQIVLGDQTVLQVDHGFS